MLCAGASHRVARPYLVVASLIECRGRSQNAGRLPSPAFSILCCVLPRPPSPSRLAPCSTIILRLQVEKPCYLVCVDSLTWISRLSLCWPAPAVGLSSFHFVASAKPLSNLNTASATEAALQQTRTAKPKWYFKSHEATKALLSLPVFRDHSTCAWFESGQPRASTRWAGRPSSSPGRRSASSWPCQDALCIVFFLSLRWFCYMGRYSAPRVD